MEVYDETIEKYLKDDINDIKTDKILKSFRRQFMILYVHKNNKKLLLANLKLQKILL